MQYAGRLLNIKWRLWNSSTCSSFSCVSITELSENFRTQHVPRVACHWLAAVITSSEINYTHPSISRVRNSRFRKFSLSPLQWTEAWKCSTIRSGLGAEGRKETISSQHFGNNLKKEEKKLKIRKRCYWEAVSYLRIYALLGVLGPNHSEKATDEGMYNGKVITLQARCGPKGG